MQASNSARVFSRVISTGLPPQRGSSSAISVSTPARPTSDPVPAVLGTAMIGAILLALAPAQRKLLLGKGAIKRVHDASRGRYGARKVWHVLRLEGRDIARCRVRRLVRALQIQAIGDSHGATAVSPAKASRKLGRN